MSRCDGCASRRKRLHPMWNVLLCVECRADWRKLNAGMEARRSTAMLRANDVRDDVMRALLGGERSAVAIATDFGLSERTVVRYRKAMRAYGLRVLVPTQQGELYDPAQARAA